VLRQRLLHGFYRQKRLESIGGQGNKTECDLPQDSGRRGRRSAHGLSRRARARMLRNSRLKTPACGFAGFGDKLRHVSRILIFPSPRTMRTDYLILTYVVSLLAGLSGLAIYSEMRSRRFGPASSEDRIFRCKNCGLVYTDDADVERSRCSQCGRSNDAIEF